MANLLEHAHQIGKQASWTSLSSSPNISGSPAPVMSTLPGHAQSPIHEDVTLAGKIADWFNSTPPFYI